MQKNKKISRQNVLFLKPISICIFTSLKCIYVYVLFLQKAFSLSYNINTYFSFDITHRISALLLPVSCTLRFMSLDI